jgi:hypothetical protein
MALYRVRVEGRNLVLATDQANEPVPPRKAFVTSRLVDAPNAEDAGERAMQAIWDDAGLRDQIANAEEDPPLLYLSSVDEAGVDDALTSEELGYTIFEEEPTDLTALLGND